jgi:hypothetical protein
LPAAASNVGAARLTESVARSRALSSAAQTSREGCAKRAQTDTLLVSGPFRR